MPIVFTFTVQDAILLLGVMPIAATFLTSLLKRVDWPDWCMLAIAIGWSTLGGILTIYIKLATTGEQPQAITVIAFAAMVATAANIHYQVWFKGSRAERAVNAPAARATRAADELKLDAKAADGPIPGVSEPTRP